MWSWPTIAMANPVVENKAIEHHINLALVARDVLGEVDKITLACVFFTRIMDTPR